MSDNLFGFSTEAPTGTFLPIVKYDAKAGRMFRIDRVEGANGYESVQEDITDIFSALVDFEHIEVGWIDFATGGAPSFVMTQRGKEFPKMPSTTHKRGIRYLLKLSKACAEGRPPVREIAGTSRAFLATTEAIVGTYLAEKDQHPGLLPVLGFDGKPVPVKTGSGAKTSTNYHPRWKILGWAPRGDLVHPDGNKALTGKEAYSDAPTNGRSAPQTGSTRAEPPFEMDEPATQKSARQKPAFDANDFG